MADAAFENRRLAQLYDQLDPDRSDLDVYATMTAEFDATTIVDIGCGTGTFAALLAERGLRVIGVEPAAASLEVAKSKTQKVTWIHGTVTDLPGLNADLVFMTANVAQVFVGDDEWTETLRAVGRVLRPGGRLIFESRIPQRQAWRTWTKEHTHRRTVVTGVGEVETWCDVLDAPADLTATAEIVSFRWTYVFRDGETLTSDSTLRFRSQDEFDNTLAEAGFHIEEVRDAPDRPGREWVFIAVRIDRDGH